MKKTTKEAGLHSDHRQKIGHALVMAALTQKHLRSFLLILAFAGLGIACSKANIEVKPQAAINCSSASVQFSATVGNQLNGVISLPYTSGNGAKYSAGTQISSTGVKGLTATLQAGILANGAGNLAYAISGVATEPGTASFPISFGTDGCTLSLKINDLPFVQYGAPFAGVPDPQDAIIYQVNIRCFTSTRNFQSVISRLDSIKNIGVNVIYLLPFYPIGTLKGVNSPYCIKDYTGINSDFGNLSDLRALVDGAHSRGMAVLFDWVANHTSWDNSWITSHKDWYQLDGSGNIVSPSQGWLDVAQLNFTNYSMRSAMIRAMKYWVYNANCDGFRCDYADGPPADFWKQAIDTMRSITSHRLLMLAEGSRSDHFGSGFNYTFGFRLYDQLKAIYSHTGTIAGGIDNVLTTEYASANELNRVVHYITNHDVNSQGSPLDWFGGKTGSTTAFVLAAYIKGVPMIYNGQEVGTPTPLYFMSTNSLIDWSLNPGMVTEYKKIIALYNRSTAIRRGIFTSYNSTDVCAFTRVYGNETIFVVCNLRNTTVNYTLPVSITTSLWTDAFTGSSAQIASQITLAPNTYLVFKKN